MTTMIDELLSQIVPQELADQLGTDPDTAMDAARKALPALLGGLSSNVSAGGADALGAALWRDHDGSLLDSADPLAAVDAVDGQKIIGHIFGDRQDQVVEKLGATSGAGSSLFSKLLPLLAPLVMAWLAKQVGGSLAGAGGTAKGTTPAGGSGGGLGDLLGGLLGGGGSGGGLGDLLGGLLGGQVESGKAAMPDLGDLFDMLGGAARKP